MTLFSRIIAFLQHILNFFKQEEKAVIAEVAAVEAAIKRECSACHTWVEHFVSREGAGTKCHDCAKAKK